MIWSVHWYEQAFGEKIGQSALCIVLPFILMYSAYGIGV